MPYIVLETIAAQKPIICTKVGGIPEIFEQESSSLVEAGNVAALADKMAVSLNNGNLQTEASERRENLKKRFSVTVMADGMMQAYQSCLEENSEKILQAW